MSAEWKLLDNSKVYNHKVIPILTKEESKNLIRWHKSHKHLTSVGSGEDYFGSRKIHINNEYIRLLFQKVETHCTAAIYKATGKVFYPEMSTMTEWPIGGFQDPHLDTYSHQEREDEGYNEEEREKSPRREWTVIVYLNDDYTGGETYFPPSDYYPFGYQVEKNVGDGLLFQGIYHPHGVFKVRRNNRYTISIWFTEDLDKAMTQRPVKDIGHNENTIKTSLNYRPDDLLFTKDVTQNQKEWIEYKKSCK